MGYPTIDRRVREILDQPYNRQVRLAYVTEILRNYGMSDAEMFSTYDRALAALKSAYVDDFNRRAADAVDQGLDQVEAAARAAVGAIPGVGQIAGVLQAAGIDVVGDLFGSLSTVIGNVFGTNPPSHLRKSKEVAEALRNHLDRMNKEGARYLFEPNTDLLYRYTWEEVFRRAADNSDHANARQSFRAAKVDVMFALAESQIDLYIQRDSIQAQALAGAANSGGADRRRSLRRVAVAGGAVAAGVGLVTLLARRA